MNTHVSYTGPFTTSDPAGYEVVERKGLGHPDTICDTIADRMSKAYVEYTKKEFGGVLHHNFDKSLLSAGFTRVEWGGGYVAKPMKFIYGDRAVHWVGEHPAEIEVPVGRICSRVVADYFKEITRGEFGLDIQKEVGMGSQSLLQVFERDNPIPISNDTSATVGYAPLSSLEKFVMWLETYLKNGQPKWLGNDIKIMAARSGSRVRLTVAAALISEWVQSVDDYEAIMDNFYDRIWNYIADHHWKDKFDVEWQINTLDAPEPKEPGDIYLTLAGLSAENGDSGEVGRGNNVKGVIPLNRPMGAEAAAGKNPTSHIGKIYNHLAHRIADRIVEETGVSECYVHLVNDIGSPINTPSFAGVQYRNGSVCMDQEPVMREIVRDEFNGIQDYLDMLMSL